MTNHVRKFSEDGYNTRIIRMAFIHVYHDLADGFAVNFSHTKKHIEKQYARVFTDLATYTTKRYITKRDCCILCTNDLIRKGIIYYSNQ